MQHHVIPLHDEKLVNLLATMGYFRRGSFSITLQARDCFLQAYESAASSLPRLALYLGMAFLQSLHYELWVMKNDKPAIIEPWLDISERGVLRGEMAANGMVML